MFNRHADPLPVYMHAYASSTVSFDRDTALKTYSVNAYSLVLSYGRLMYIGFLLFVAVSFHVVCSREYEFLVRLQAHLVADRHIALGKHPDKDK